jgi:hypothetical protein
LIEACKEYRLGDAAIMLRMLLVLGQQDNRITRDTLEFILSQQKASGSFGYFAKDFDNTASLTVQLSWTVGISWVLADYAYSESSPTRLFDIPSKYDFAQPLVEQVE